MAGLAKGTTVSVSRLDIAIAQLDRSIELLLRHQDYICSITLAGAADEILGRLVAESGSMAVDATSDLKNYLALESGLSPKEVNDHHLNRVRNNLKHYDNGMPLMFQPIEEAVQIIARALTNLHDACGRLTERGHEFVQWTKKDASWRE